MCQEGTPNDKLAKRLVKGRGYANGRHPSPRAQRGSAAFLHTFASRQAKTRSSTWQTEPYESVSKKELMLSGTGGWIERLGVTQHRVPPAVGSLASVGIARPKAERVAPLSPAVVA